jgi:hypothetical protein
MGLKSEKLHDFPLEAGTKAILDLLAGDDDVSMVVEKHGDTVRVATMQRYDNDAKRILAKAREEQRQRTAQGYSREEAFADMEAVRTELKRL